VGSQTALNRWISWSVLISVLAGMLLVGLSMSFALINVDRLQHPDSFRWVSAVFLVAWLWLPLVAALGEASAMRSTPGRGAARSRRN
jgi:hypothetical protein